MPEGPGDDPDRGPARLPRRARGDAGPTDFETLRRAGLGHLRALSAGTWTDHNLHDPGITVLEQVCFAITEIAYRAELPVADLLADPDGRLDLEALALQGPLAVLPCRPATAGDQALALLDAVPEVENLAVRADPRTGLLHVDALPRAPVAGADDRPPDPALPEALGAAFAARRNLCEDLGAVRCLAPDPRRLRAVIEIDDTRPPVEVLAEVFHTVSRVLSGRPRFEPHGAGAEGSGEGLDRALEGPLLRHGRVEEAPGLRIPGGDPGAELARRVGAVEGVARVRSLALEPAAEDGRSSDEAALPVLRVSGPGWADGVRLRRNAREVPVPVEALSDRLAALAWGGAGSAPEAPDPERMHPPPRGRPRPPEAQAAFASLRSLEDGLPGIYGVGPGDLPTSAPAEARAAARQLRGYLALLDQQLADVLADVTALRDSCAVATAGRRGHGFGPDDATVEPRLARALRDGLLPPDFLERSAAARRAVEDAEARAGAVLDRLLALHGEVCSQFSLARFDWYGTVDGVGDAVRNRQRFLEHVVRAGADRGAGFDYTRPYWNTDNVSGLHLRTALQLGFEGPPFARRLCDGLRGHGLAAPGENPDPGPDADAGPAALRPLPPDPSRESAPLDAAIEAGLDDLALSPGAADLHLDPELLREGVFPHAYGLADGEDGAVLLRFVPRAGGSWTLGRFRSDGEAADAAAALQRWLRGLNRDSEGLHVVEHLLLRTPDLDPAQVGDLAHRVSVVLPRWTARCRDERFLDLVREVVHQNAPAHLRVEILFLDWNPMRAFEGLLDRWLEGLRRHGPGAPEIAADAVALREHLEGVHGEGVGSTSA